MGVSQESTEDPRRWRRRFTAADDLEPHGDECRRARMLALIQEREFVRVSDLSDRFGISEVTVRNDLAALAERGGSTGSGGARSPGPRPGTSARSRSR